MQSKHIVRVNVMNKTTEARYSSLFTMDFSGSSGAMKKACVQQEGIPRLEQHSCHRRICCKFGFQNCPHRTPTVHKTTALGTVETVG